MRWIALTVALLVVALAPAPSAAQSSPRQALEQIRELTFQAQFEQAIEAARALLEQGDLNAEDRNAALEAMAIAQIANRQTSDAGETLTLLFSRDPGHRLTDPDASPPVLSAFARAREASPPTVGVRFEHTPPALTQREPPNIIVGLSQGADAVGELRLVYRAGGENEARVVMNRRPDGTFAARIPVVGDAGSAVDIAYHVIALAPSQHPLAQLGSPAEPVQIRIPAEGGGGAAVTTSAGTTGATPEPLPASSTDPGPIGEPPTDGGEGSVAEEAWFWILIGVLVIGAGVGVGLGVALSAESPQDGTLGTVTLMQLEY